MVGSSLIKNCIAVTAQGRMPCSILIKDEKIFALLTSGERAVAEETIDARGRYVIPGAIDTHVHLGTGEQGFAGDCATESECAVTGGVTTMMQYLNQLDSYLKVYSDYKEAVEANSLVDMAFHIMLFTDEQLEEVASYVQQLHITSYKFLMSLSLYEIPGSGYVRPTDGFLLDGFTVVGKQPGCIALLHAENSEIIQRIRPRIRAQGRNDTAAWSDSRPIFCEEEAIARGILLAKIAKTPLTIVHMTSARGAQFLSQQEPDVSLYAETCPQYLLLHKDMALGSAGKVDPPLRSQEDRAALWRAVAGEQIDFMGSDHCTWRKATKGSELWSALSGLPGMAMILPALLSEGVNKQRISLEQLVRLTSYNAARIFGLYPKKGTIAPGSDADLVILDLEKEITITHEVLNSYVDWTPYEGYNCCGWPWLTMVKGRVVYQEGQIMDRSPRGKVVCHSMFEKRSG